MHKEKVVEKIGFIGLGIMGKAMVENLAKAGHKVNVYARRQASVKALETDNLESFATPAELAKASSVVISCVSDTPDVEQVLVGAEGVIHGVKAGSLVIDMSTISPESTQEMADKFSQAGVSMLDAPVSGGEVGAIAASLSIMVGGEEKDFQRATPIFECLGKNIIHVGASGAGQVAKACNNLVAAQTVVAVAEAYLLARNCNVDPAKVRDALLGGFAYSRVLELHGQRILDENYIPGFKTKLHAKDLQIALKSADKNSIKMPGTELSDHYLQALLEQGDGELDSSAIAKVILENG
ncbi:MAG: NAD(P)-dependent oxidoreductase [Gammaproteobacteria bacterium]|nr:NAD(P)-dependent oxidoreductase [Gammaproteobacteria bacterium]